MDATKIFQQQDYELRCGARVVDSGKFVPTLTVSKHGWPTRLRQIAIRPGHYVSEDVAIDVAYAEGVEWVRNYG